MIEFWRFKTQGLEGYTEIQGSFDADLVVLSIVIASMASYSMLVILERIWSSSAKSHILWNLLGSAVFGLGVWSMHFTGMIAFQLNVVMEHDVLITILSILPVIIGASVSLNILAKKRFKPIELQFASLCLALGIGSMHFLGMEAMKMQVEMRYDFGVFVLSILVAHLLATAALYTRVIVKTTEGKHYLIRILSALFMGIAISAMHYTAMMSANYHVASLESTLTAGYASHSMIFPAMISSIVMLFVAVIIIGTIVDRRLEDAKTQAEKSILREQSVVETLIDSVVVVDEQGRIVLCNAASALLLGLDQSQLEGMSLSDALPKIAEELSRSEDQSISEAFELNITSHKGRELCVEFTSSKVELIDTYLISIAIRDIGKRKLMESQLRQAQKLESIGQLAAGIAHEINTPIQYIGDNTEFMKDSFEELASLITDIEAICLKNNSTDGTQTTEMLRNCYEDHDYDFLKEDMPKAIDQTIEGISRVSKIVAAMKDFSHPGSDEKEALDINRAVESTATIASHVWKYVATLEFDLDEKMAEYHVFSGLFNEVILNLIVNAAHAIEDSNQSLRREKGVIKIITRREPKFGIISICDNGAGMPENIKEKIFDQFFTTKEVGKGTGQGLALSRSIIVDKHSGELSFDSKEGIGTTFVVKIPEVIT